MFFFFNILIQTVAGFIPGFILLLPVFLSYHNISIEKDKMANLKTSIHHLLGVCIFCFILLSILSATGIPDAYSMKLYLNGNFIPFSDIITNPSQYLLNVLLFVPLGFFLPLLWRKYECKKRAFSFGFLLSLAIELIQLFSFRATDIDDLLMNTLGTIIGYYLFILLKCIYPNISKISIQYTKYWQYESYFCVLFTWFIMLFIQPYFSGLIWNLIL